jgi:hypothetical protein
VRVQHGTLLDVVVEFERWFVMKRFLLVATAAFALLVPTLTFAQVKIIYIPGAHPRVVVVPPVAGTPTAKAEKAPLTSTEVIARHAPMAGAQRASNRVNYSAVAHCERVIAEAQQQLRANL